MKHLTLLLTLGLFALLTACTEADHLLLPEENTPSAAVDFRDADCLDFCSLDDISGCCNDFSDCSSLAGKKAFNYLLGPPPITTTGQEPGDPLIPGFGFCGPFEHPFFFHLTGGFTEDNIVEAAPHLGRLQSVEFDVCIRPYILESFDPVPAFLEPIPFELYTPCHELEGDWTLTAANGDQLWLNLQTAAYPDCDNLDFYLIEGQWVVTGGTGRFEEATGGGCLTGSGWANFFDPNPQALNQWLLEGGIDY